MHFAKRAILAFFPFSLLFSFTLYAEVEIGGACSEPDQIYHYVTDIRKTVWQIDELYAVPVGTLSPEDWEYAEPFEQRILTIIGGNRTPEAFAQACGGIWRDYFTYNAEVLVSFQRNIAITDNVLKCISGNWALQSTETIQKTDISDWLRIGNQPWDVNQESSVTLLQQELEFKLNDLNSQPGAGSEPNTAQ